MLPFFSRVLVLVCLMFSVRSFAGDGSQTVIQIDNSASSGAPFGASTAQRAEFLGKWAEAKFFDTKTNLVSTFSCRPAGVACSNSGQCCSFCHDGVCNGEEVGSCRPAGYACTNSGQCCSFCHDGVCNGQEAGSCRGEGLKCENSGQCCHFCHDGTCN